MPTLIADIHASERLDSAGFPTIECVVNLTNGEASIVQIPTGAHQQRHTSYQLIDQDPTHYHGQGLLKAIENINHWIQPQILGEDPTDQVQIDSILNRLDPTPNHQDIGINSIHAVSLGVCKAGSIARKTKLYSHLAYLANNDRDFIIPTPIATLINGQPEHQKLNFQEYCLSVNPNAKMDIPHQIESLAGIFHQLEYYLKSNNINFSYHQEGGIVIDQLNSNRHLINIILEVANSIGLTHRQMIDLSLDMSASNYFSESGYTLSETQDAFDSQHYYEYLNNLIHDYSPLILEDPFPDFKPEDWINYSNPNSLIAADDLRLLHPHEFNPSKIPYKAIVIKPNQIGTITDILNLIHASQNQELKIIISQRSRETIDTFIVDLAIGVNADYLRLGSLHGLERIVKYNHLIDIYHQLFTN